MYGRQAAHEQAGHACSGNTVGWRVGLAFVFAAVVVVTASVLLTFGVAVVTQFGVEPQKSESNLANKNTHVCVHSASE